jgi:hypothetical protein
MKLLKWVLVFVGICCSSNSYTMQSKNQDLAEKLSKANELIKNAEGIIKAINNNFSRSILIMPIGYDEKIIEYRGIAVSCADSADNLVQLILKHQAATDSIKGNAIALQQRIAFFKKEVG